MSVALDPGAWNIRSLLPPGRRPGRTSAAFRVAVDSRYAHRPVAVGRGLHPLRGLPGEPRADGGCGAGLVAGAAYAGQRLAAGRDDPAARPGPPPEIVQSLVDAVVPPRPTTAKRARSCNRPRRFMRGTSARTASSSSAACCGCAVTRRWPYRPVWPSRMRNWSARNSPASPSCGARPAAKSASRGMASRWWTARCRGGDAGWTTDSPRV